MSWEDTFKTWAQGPGQSENEKCENAERVIFDALNNDARLSGLNILVFTQGSYKARTNISQDSDVDICVLLRDEIFVDYAEGISDSHTGLSNSTGFTIKQFKDIVEEALIKKFGRNQVTRGNKAFDIHENTYRIAADVVPAFEHRRYTGTFSSDGSANYISGIEIHPDKGAKIINWPEQTYLNGIDKNNATSRRYKRVIRILKKLRNRMQDDKIEAANDIASFLIESLVWNTPKEGFNHSTYVEDVRYVLAHTCNETRTDENCKEWGEVNELKYLFRDLQPWSRKQANAFLNAAWRYVGFE